MQFLLGVGRAAIRHGAGAPSAAVPSPLQIRPPPRAATWARLTGPPRMCTHSGNAPRLMTLWTVTVQPRVIPRAQLGGPRDSGLPNLLNRFRNETPIVT